MNILLIGSLVVSEHFEGTGKIVSVNIDSNFATVAFFESPAQPYARQIEVNRDKLSLTIPPEEAVIYCLEPQVSAGHAHALEDLDLMVISWSFFVKKNMQRSRLIKSLFSTKPMILQ